MSTHDCTSLIGALAGAIVSYTASAQSTGFACANNKKTKLTVGLSSLALFIVVNALQAKIPDKFIRHINRFIAVSPSVMFTIAELVERPCAARDAMSVVRKRLSAVEIVTMFALPLVIFEIAGNAKFHDKICSTLHQLEMVSHAGATKFAAGTKSAAANAQFAYKSKFGKTNYDPYTDERVAKTIDDLNAKYGATNSSLFDEGKAMASKYGDSAKADLARRAEQFLHDRYPSTDSVADRAKAYLTRAKSTHALEGPDIMTSSTRAHAFARRAVLEADVSAEDILALAKSVEAEEEATQRRASERADAKRVAKRLAEDANDSRGKKPRDGEMVALDEDADNVETSETASLEADIPVSGEADESEEEPAGAPKKGKDEKAADRLARHQRNAGSVLLRPPGKLAKWTFAEVQKRLASGVELLTTRQEFDEQDQKPSKRLITVKLANGDRKTSRIDSFLTGHTRGEAASAAEKAVHRAKQSQTLKMRKLGQRHWLEAAGVRAAMILLDPENKMLVVNVPDEIGPDSSVRLRDSSPDLFAVIQAKSGEGNGETQVCLSVKAEDGAVGGRYEKLIILGIIVRILDPHPRRTMRTFDAIPEVEATDVFLYANATEIHSISLLPNARTASNKDTDEYGDHRYTVGVDSLDRLERMRETFFQLVRDRSLYTKADIWFGSGPGSLSPEVSSRHTEEQLNCRALSEIVGFENLWAPARQNEAVDVVWSGVRISLKSASSDGKKGLYLGKRKAPLSELCHYVFIFYRAADRTRTHVSVVDAARVYGARKPNGEFIEPTFCWSKTNNSDVLSSRIDLRLPNAAELLRAAVSLPAAAAAAAAST